MRLTQTRKRAIEPPSACAETTISASGSVQNFEPEFLDHGVRQHVLGNALDFRLGLVEIQALQRKDKKFPLAHFLHAGMPQRSERSLNGLALRIENGGLQHHPDVCFHLPNYISPADFAAA